MQFLQNTELSHVARADFSARSSLFPARTDRRAHAPTASMSFPKLEYAKTGRSTCRRCGEAIAAGDLRVGIEAFVAGRVADTWQHPRCALEACYLERCSANRGKCKATDETFKKGDIRLAVCSKDHKTYYSVKGMGDALKPTLEAVGDFSPSDITGFKEELSEDERATVSAALGVEERSGKRARRSSRGASVAEVRVASAEKNAKAEPEAAKVKAEATPSRSTRASRRASNAAAAVGTPQPADASPAKPSRATPVAPADATDGLTDFEREREERIARNKERMAALNIGQLAAEVAPAKSVNGPIQRGIGAKRTRAPKEDVGPPRRSGRVAKLALDPALAAGVDYERRDGSVMLMNGTSTGWRYGEQEDKGPSRPEGDVKLESVNGTESADEAFIAFLRDSLAAPTEAAKSFKSERMLTAEAFNATVAGARTGKAPVPTSASSLAAAKLSLTDEAVAKVVPRGVTHLDIAPYDPAGPVVVAAGDKDGAVGLWRVDGNETPADDEGDGSEDGVLYYKPHGSYICHLKWGRGGLGGKLVTCAYDGAVRALDAEKGCFVELFVSEDEDEFSACDVTADGRTMHLVDNQGNYHVVDVRSGKLASPAVELHEKKINTVHLEPGAERVMATSCGDQTVQVWDVRKSGKGAKPLSRLQHSKSCQAAYFAPDGSGNLLTTCYDDLLRVWRPAGGSAGAVNDDPKSALKIKHNNQTGRWVLPFRAIWTPGADGVVVGSMRREVEVFDANKGSLVAKYSDGERMTAIASRMAVHPTLNVIAAGTASGRIHIYR